MEGHARSPYLFLPLQRLFVIGAEIDARGRLGPNYELVNNLSRYFDLLQRMARERLAKDRGVVLEKLQWPKGTLHDLRRTYGTRMSRVVPMHVLKEYMGHAKITTTQEYYLAAETQDAERARAAMDAMARENEPANSGRNQDAIGGPRPQSPESKNNESPGIAETSVSEADGTRTRNHRIDSQRGECPNPRHNADLHDIPPAPAAPAAAPRAESPLPPDLAVVVAAWPALPPAVRAGIAAMVQASAAGH